MEIIYKGNDIIGKSIFACDIGENIASVVEDLVLAPNSRKLLGFVVTKDCQAAEALVLPFDCVQSLGPDAIAIQSIGVLIPIKELELEKAIEQGRIRDSKVVTTKGRDLGIIADIYFDAKTGAVEGYEICAGVVADTFSGRSLIRATEDITIKSRVVFVRDRVAAVEEQIGGIQGVFQKAKERVQETAHLTGEKLHLAAQEASEKIQEAVEQAEKQYQQFKHQSEFGSQEEFDSVQPKSVLGKIVNQTVYIRRGTPLILKGQRVTPAIAAAANRWKVLNKLSQAVGNSQPTYQLQNKLTGEQCRLGGDNNSSVEEQLIKNALGRPVKQAVLDRQHNIILNVGELITYQAIERAKQADVLPKLLDSVYSGP